MTGRVRCLAALVLGLSLSGAAAAGEYVKRETARATWDAYLANQGEGVKLGPWWYLGPFDNPEHQSFDKVFPPEEQIALQASYPGKNGRTVKWLPGDKFKDDETNSLRIFDDNDWIVVYLYRRIASPVARALPVLFGSDDFIVVWCNGEKVVSHNTGRACRLGDERAVLDLKAGDNDLLIKIGQGGGPSGFAFGLDRGDESILKQLAVDFPNEFHEFQVEQDWRRWDGLQPGATDYQAAARQALKLAQDTSRLIGSADYDRRVAELAQRAAEPNADRRSLWRDARWLRRKALLARPELSFEQLLINERPPTTYSHMDDQYLGRHSRPGPGLCLLDDWRTNPQRTVLLADKLPVGSTLHPELSYDGRKVIFSFCDHAPPQGERTFLLYEAELATRELRQLTFDPDQPGDPLRERVRVEDFDPVYLPEGGFVFISTRNRGFGRCHGGRYVPSYVLFRANADGGEMREISYNEANEWDPVVLPSGQLLYSRWDYINRHDTIFQSLWTTRPDGTATAHYYGNYTRNPCMIAEGRPIPGTDKVIATATAHHSFTAGSLIILDPKRGQDGDAPLTRLTPEASFPETEGWPDVSYASPYPLSEDLVLAAFSPYRHVHQGEVQRVEAYGIYLVDSAGGRELIYRDPEMSSFTPLPVRAEPAPPALPSMVDPGQQTGVFFIHNVYDSTEELEPGSVKRLRVVQIYKQPTARVPRRSRVDNEIVKGVLGTVPVNPDGSVAFRAPAETPMLFQLLDEHDTSVFSMRSLVYLQRGETQSCAGCHESRARAAGPRPSAMPPVAEIRPPPGPHYDGGFSFARTVQPVLDRRCISCHGLDGKAGDVNLLGEPTHDFNVAYETLTGPGGWVALAHRNSETWSSRPGDYGAEAGQLAGFLRGSHRDVAKLQPDEFQRIAEWLDLNGQYYGDYAFDRPERRTPHEAGLKALRSALQSDCGSCHQDLSKQPTSALLNVALPSQSRVLLGPLAASAGGWGDCRTSWGNREDPGYRKLAGLLNDAVSGAEPK